MSQEQLRQAVTLMKQGDKRQATQIVQSVIKQDRNNVAAWWLMANVLDDPARKKKALEKVLSLDPDHARAKKMLASSGNKPAPSAPKKTTSPKPARADDPDDGKPAIELEFDWGKLDARDAKVKEVKTGSEDKAIRMASMAMGVLVIIVIIIAIIFGVIPSMLNQQIANRIETVMTDFLTIMIDGDIESAETFVCEAKHRDQGRANNFAFGINNPYAQFEPDFSELEFVVSDITADSALVELTGTVTLTPEEGDPQVLLIEDIMGAEAFTYGTTFEFVVENDEWRVCATRFGE